MAARHFKKDCICWCRYDEARSLLKRDIALTCVDTESNTPEKATSGWLCCFCARVANVKIKIASGLSSLLRVWATASLPISCKHFSRWARSRVCCLDEPCAVGLQFLDVLSHKGCQQHMCARQNAYSKSMLFRIAAQMRLKVYNSWDSSNCNGVCKYSSWEESTTDNHHTRWRCACDQWRTCLLASNAATTVIRGFSESDFRVISVPWKNVLTHDDNCRKYSNLLWQSVSSRPSKGLQRSRWASWTALQPNLNIYV